MLEFSPMDFHPGCDQPFLRLRQPAAKTLDRVDGVNGGVFRKYAWKWGRWCDSPASTYIRMMIPKNRDSSGTRSI